MSEHNHSTPVGDEEHNEITNNQINENETQNHQENNPFKMEKEKEESITGFGRTDEERYAMLERMQQDARKVRGKRITALFKEEEEEPSNEQQMEIPNKHFELDIRQAIIANEILNRKY